jgi:hypothetical protein
MEIQLGNLLQQQELRCQLGMIRLLPRTLLHKNFRTRAYSTLSELLTLQNDLLDSRLFVKGVDQFQRDNLKFARDFSLLPLERVFVLHNGPMEPELRQLAYLGGYYSPGQSYYHLEQVSITSVLGSFVNGKYDKTLTTLELLRSYLHDCIHFNTFRSYKFSFNSQNDNVEPVQIYRHQYGFNFRKENGMSFSCPDPPGSKTTRNLGIIMEGLTDAFSKRSIERLLISESLEPLNLCDFQKVILHEITWVLDEVIEPSLLVPVERAYLSAIRAANDSVWNPYRKFLREFATHDAIEFEELLYSAMLNGDQLSFADYINNIHGDIDAFNCIFRQKGF